MMGVVTGGESLAEMCSHSDI